MSVKVEYSMRNTSLMDSLLAEGHFPHRGGRWYCPHCGYGSYETHYEWFKKENMVQVIWMPRILFSLDAAFVISYCPNPDRENCRKPSWEHAKLDLMDFYNHKGADFDLGCVNAEIERRTKKCKEEWESSLCRTCTRLKNSPRDWWSSWGSCNNGTASAKKECSQYVLEVLE